MKRSCLTAVLPVALTAFVACGGEPAPTPGTKFEAPEATVAKSEAAPMAAEATDSSDAEEQDPVVEVDRAAVVSLFGSDPVAPEVKENRRLKKEKVELGRKLYHETALSRNNDVSCATCHDLNNYGQDGKATSPGTGGAAGKRNTPTVFNAYRQFKQFWDARAETVEMQSTMPMTTINEHGLNDDAEIVAILKGIPEYADLFKAAFPTDEDPLTADNVRLAFGAFERKLETRSRFDDYLDGNDDALSNQEKRGLKTFMSKGCTTCHTTRLLGGHMIQKLGLIRPFDSKDLGRFEVTQNEGDKHMWKVPQLLNVAKTGPYLHDGSVATLEEMTELMAKHQTGQPLSASEVADVVAFLTSLTGEPPAIVKN